MRTGMLLTTCVLGFGLAVCPAGGAEESQTAPPILHRLSVTSDVLSAGAGGTRQQLEALAGGVYDYCIQADSHPDNTVLIGFRFVSNPGEVSFSRSPACGSLEPTRAQATRDPDTGVWWVTTKYNPCETECTSVRVTATPTSGQSQTKTVHVDERYHIGCGGERQLGVATCAPDPIDPNICTPNQAWVTVTVIPVGAGTASPSSGNSHYNPDSALWEFWSTYKPGCTYEGRVRVKFSTSNAQIVYSFEQNAQTITPLNFWQTVCESFCTEGEHTNYSQVYKMYLLASQRYNFSLNEWDGVGARCDADGDLKMFDSSGKPLFSLEDLWWNDTTIGTIYEDWSPPSDGNYYLHLLGWDFLGYETPMSYCLAYSAGDCFPDTYTTYNDWVKMGKPNCWCSGYKYQCDGDADGIDSGGVNKYRVFTGDLNLIIKCWKKKPGEPDCACADIDHKDSGGINKYRVFVKDLNIIVANWKKKDTALPGNCPRPE